MLRETSKINRLNEFYDFAEIDWYLSNIREKGLSLTMSLQYLYYSTINDYRKTEREPEIHNSLLSYLYIQNVL